MIHLNEGDPPLLIGFLPSEIELPCEDGTWSVLLAHRTFDHICKRRENERPEHLALVLARIGAVIESPSHIGCLSGEPHKLDLWAWNGDDISGVLVSLKCLSGETWVNTAFPMGRKTLRKHLSKGRLKPIAVPEGRKVTAAPCSGSPTAAGSKEMEEQTDLPGTRP